MHYFQTSVISFGLLATSSLVAGHAAIIGATGDLGGAGSAIGVNPDTPRDGTRRNPFQQDATRFKGAAADSCGETLEGGANDIQSGTAKVMALNGPTLPQVSAGGSIQMTVHQVNADGAGPYTCMIDTTGTGTNWKPIQVTTNLEGNARGRNAGGNMQDLPLTASIPAGTVCTGTVAGQQNVCMVRCQNPARAGPFGGCVPVQMKAAGNAAAGNAAAGNAAAGNAAAGNAAAGNAAAVNNAAAANNAAAGNNAAAVNNKAAANNAAAAGNAAVPAGNAAATAGNAANLAAANTANSNNFAANTAAAAGNLNAGNAGQFAANTAANAVNLAASNTNNALNFAGQAANGKRATKTAADGTVVTDDAEEEEVELTQRLRRWIPASLRK